MSDPAADPVLARFPRIRDGFDGEVRVTVSRDPASGETFVHVRRWYVGPRGVMVPTKQGTAFRLEELGTLVAALKEAKRVARTEAHLRTPNAGWIEAP